jgi:FKBP-type peptidyl-prolyl cis-trans isomerase
MKKILFPLLLASFVLFACNAKDSSAASGGEPSKSDTSYAFGIAIGNSIKQTSVEIDYNAFLNGLKDAMEGKKAKMTAEEANTAIQAAITARMAVVSEQNKAKEAKYLEENGKKSGVTTTASGLQYEVITQGAGAKPSATDVVKVDYVGTLLDGTTFDSSVSRGEPAVFPLDQVIPGWTEGIQLMSIGSKYKFYIPSSLAYGESGAGDVITPYSTLIFEVDLLSIEK